MITAAAIITKINIQTPRFYLSVLDSFKKAILLGFFLVVG